MRMYSHVLGWSSLSRDYFLEWAGCVPPDETSIPTKLHPHWNHFQLFSFSVSRWCFRTSRTVPKYARHCVSVSPCSNTSSKMIFWGENFNPISLDNVSHYIFSFIIIAKNIGAKFREPIGITFHRLFLSGKNNSSLSRAYYSASTCQYSLFISTAIKYLASVLMSCTASSQRGMGKENGRGKWFSFW